MQIPFSPHYKSNQNVTAADPAAIVTISKDDNQIRIVNSGNATAYVCAYNSAGTVQIATTADYMIPAGDATIITKSFEHDRLSYYCATSTTLSIMTGRGL